MDRMTEHESKKLRTGRTTGSCATAAAMAGTLYLLGGECPETVDVPLPPGGTLRVPIARFEKVSGGVRVTVVKDGGDDPDATHGHDIQAVVSMSGGTSGPLRVEIDGGAGVGRASLPGLPIPVGQAAINPEPRKQIEQGVRQAAKGMGTGSISVLVEVPNGHIIARKTMNARLGILGGISILGTQGIVKPYSHASWKATIEEGLDVARAQGLDAVVLTTGRRSERLYLEAFPGVPELACIQAADFFESSMRAAADRGMARVTWSLFFGKLVKQAQGLAYTHAKTHPIDFDRLAGWCSEAGCAHEHIQDILNANTARQVLALLEDDRLRFRLIAALIDRATRVAQAFSGDRCAVDYAVFDFDGTRLDMPTS
ncbi:cobalt-precorrin-5B (C(1))-methyltransferase CbiD [Pseudodesulfovibrio piezophilus]|nr:cobalt-precorrin-5B (C(1))-methyltransferase CbiD [Pseudodesulfovibrio piezophilus]